jgi:hypothetical protein
MIISPFVVVLSWIILIQTFILAISGTNSDAIKKLVKVFVSLYFPIFLLYGFCVSSGIFMIVSLLDKEKKIRQYMYMSGLGPLEYYLGLFIADFTLFFITEFVFAMFVVIMGLSIYKSQIIAFLGMMTCFGAVLIPFTYLFQHMFSNSDSAFRFIGLFYLLLGLLLPGVLQIAGAVAGSEKGLYIMRAFSFFVDPFCTFYFGTRDLIWVYFSDLIAPNQPVIHIPVTPNIPASSWICSMTNLGQAFIYLALAIWKDYADCNKFKKSGGQDGRMQPQLNVYQDIVDHEKEVKLQSHSDKYQI